MNISESSSTEYRFIFTQGYFGSLFYFKMYDKHITFLRIYIMLNIIKKDNSIKKEFDSYLLKIIRQQKINRNIELFDYETKIIDFLKKSPLLNNIINDSDKFKTVYISHMSNYVDPDIYYINIENKSLHTIALFVIKKKELFNDFDLNTGYFNLFQFNNRAFYRDRKTSKKSIAYRLMLNVYEHKHKQAFQKNINKMVKFFVRFNDLYFYANGSHNIIFEKRMYKDPFDLNKSPINIIEDPNELNDFTYIPCRIEYSNYKDKTHFFYDINSFYFNRFNIEDKHHFKSIFKNFRTISKYLKKSNIKSSIHFGNFENFKIFIYLEVEGIKDFFIIPYCENINDLIKQNIFFMEPDNFFAKNHELDYSMHFFIKNLDKIKEIYEFELLKIY